jgi:DNA topoisomerase-1
MANLVILESPSKAITVKGYLGSNYKVIATVGHIRDLPKSTLGVDIENGFEPHYINIRGKGDVIKQLKKEAKSANKIFLATDPDREGEAIAWHLAKTLDIPLDKQCRVSFNEVTKNVVKEAIKSPRAIDEDLVNSQQARRILDRIVGYKLSPFLWKNVKSGLSAGRVQSVATRMIVERENEIRAFVPDEYWTIEAILGNDDGSNIVARFYGDRDGKIKLSRKEDADRVASAVKDATFKVVSVKRAQKAKQPAPPFTTSTMQQEAAKKLGFQSQRIMKVAQELYEGIDLGSEFGGVQGLITYMRTDSLRVSVTSQEAALELIRKNYGKEYLPDTPRVYKSKANAQDAHEAIRPSNVAITPKQIRKMVTADQYRLYKLIWERFVASQMAPAIFSTVAIETEAAGYLFRTGGYTVKFPGFMALYDNIEEEQNGEDGDGVSFARLPEVKQKEVLKLSKLNQDQHFTEPPARYNDASLIKIFEESGIGRPSTYATIITTIISRSYVKRDGKSLVPTPLGEVTTELMKKNFPEIVDYEFTAQMEDQLDGIEQGGSTIQSVLGSFYRRFEQELQVAEETVSRTDIEVPAEESDVLCEKCGSRMVYKNGRFGRFLACPNYPECRNTKAIGKDGAPLDKAKTTVVTADFKCELCGGDMVIRQGKFGSFYACANYPSCKFTKQKTTDIGLPCPICGSKIIIKYGRGGRMFYSCDRYPECQFSSWDLPLAERCPDCGEMLYYRRSRKLVFCRNKDAGCDYKREEELKIAEQENE